MDMGAGTGTGTTRTIKKSLLSMRPPTYSCAAASVSAVCAEGGKMGLAAVSLRPGDTHTLGYSLAAGR